MRPRRTRIPVLLLLILARLSWPVAAQTLPAEKIAKITSAISAEMSRQTIPGLSAAVVKDRRLVWSNGYGLADLENYVPAKAATVYRLGSISKPITAVAVMQLAEKGRLDLDAPAQKYCPAFPEKPWPVTTRLLLGHLAGIRHYQGDEIGSTKHYANVVDPLEIFRNDPLLHEPGARYAYSTYGYNLLGCVLEGAAGMKYLDYVRQNIFRPAGMDTIRADDVSEVIPNRAPGYTKLPNGELRNSILADTSNKIPAGGFCSTVEDLAKFAIAVQGGVLVKKETLAQMWTPQKTRDGKPTVYGLGWFLSERNGQREAGHSGGQPRITTYLHMLPEKGFAVVLMTNRDGVPGLRELARQIADIVEP